MEYLILAESDHPEMIKKVTAKIAEGWRPLGGIAAYTIAQRDHNSHEWMELWFMQAMTKETGK
jgi:hypothetical protein